MTYSTENNNFGVSTENFSGVSYTSVDVLLDDDIFLFVPWIHCIFLNAYVTPVR